jgi:hypothetical protein
MDFTELDDIITNTPGADVDAPFFTELKANLQLALLKTGTNAALPVYDDNAAALADNAAVGSLYAQANGSVWVVLAD